MEVINIRINENGVLMNPSEVVSFIQESDVNLNTKEYLANLNQYLVFKSDLKNQREVLMASSDKLKYCIIKENANPVEKEETSSIFFDDIVRVRY